MPINRILPTPQIGGLKLLPNFAPNFDIETRLGKLNDVVVNLLSFQRIGGNDHPISEGQSSTI
jgi:hypothetical protein